MKSGLWLCVLFGFLMSIKTLEVRVLTGLKLKGQANQPDYGQQKIVINSNGRYLYPSQQTPEYNVYSLPTLYYHRNFLEVVSPNYVYPLLVIDQRPNSPPTYQLVHPFTRQIMESVSEPLYVKPMDRLQFLVEETPFSIGSFLFSGTGLFLVGGIFLYLCYKSVLPKLQEAQMAPQQSQ